MMVITGAGASANLGADKTALPMMKGWAADLVPRLGFAANQLGLTEETDGPAFEAIIGRLLAFANALPAVANLAFMGEQTNVVGNGPRNGTGVQFNQWHNAAISNNAAIIRTIWASLYESFGRDRIDDDKASYAYSSLHRLIRNSFPEKAPHYITHATTNFDAAIEVAIQASTEPFVELLDGFVPASGNARPRWAPNLFSASRLDSDGRIPVLHLHGAVGWYYDTQDPNVIRRQPTDEPLDDRLVPALLLPDDTKRPDLFPAPLAEVWAQFEILLRDATHVFIVGHSLHDEHLVRAVKASEKPTAVLVLAEPDSHGKWKVKYPEQKDEMMSKLPKATLIPGNFGRGYGRDDEIPDFDEDVFTKWVDRN